VRSSKPLAGLGISDDPTVQFQQSLLEAGTEMNFMREISLSAQRDSNKDLGPPILGEVLLPYTKSERLLKTNSQRTSRINNNISRVIEV
jgi:hypothetical protein